jgi:hypothetical protein
MNEQLKIIFADLASSDDGTRMSALKTVLALTEQPVEWVYEVWDDLLQRLQHENSYQRTIAVKVLCRLAKSDHENRLAASLDHLLAHTRDEKFITSRQCIQALWEVAVANLSLRERVVAHLEQRFADTAGDAHPNLIRQDVVQSLKRIHDESKDEQILHRARALLDLDKEAKNRKGYQRILGN